MRTTVDIPDETYRALKVMAAERSTTVRQIILDGVELVRCQKRESPKKFVVPIIRSTRTDKIDLTNEQIYDIIGFP
jgi:hypothetical protein